MTALEILKAARAILWDGVSEEHGKQEYICHALGAIYQANPTGQVFERIRHLKNEVLSRLNCCSSFETFFGETTGRWLCQKTVTQVELQQERFKLLDSIIEKYEKISKDTGF